MTRLNVFIDHEAYKRLLVNSTMESLTPGLMLERLINEHCKAWSMPAPGITNPKSAKAKKPASVESDGAIDRPDGGAGVSQESSAA